MAEDDAGAVVELAAVAQLGEHAVYAVALFVHVFEEEDLPARVDLPRRAHGSRQQGEVAAAQRPARRARHQRLRRKALGGVQRAGKAAKERLFQRFEGKGVQIPVRGGHDGVIRFQTALLV